MPVICPKCSHVRPLEASNPDWQCPACGICYAKFGMPAEPPRPARAAPAVVKPAWDWGPLLKIALLVALGWGLSIAFERRQAAQAEQDTVAAEQRESAAGQVGGAGAAVLDTALQVSGMDASVLHDMAGRLEQSCARNKYGLSESACIARLREREDGCARTTALHFPGQIGDSGRMQEVMQAYVGCIFEN